MPAHINPDLPEASPLIISNTTDHIVVAMEISKASLRRHRRFLEQLIEIVRQEN